MTDKNKGSIHIDMLHGGLLRKMLVFALPLAASGILQQSFNSIDVAVVGKFANSLALAAVGCNNLIISLMVNLFIGISVGANVVISNYIGQNDKKSISRAVSTSIAVAVVSGISLMIIGEIAARPILEAIDTPNDIIELATLYLRIYLLGMPFMMVYNFGSAILRSVGDTKRPFYSLVFAGVVNTVLNLVLVICFDMSVAGVAIATVTANIINAAIMILLLKNEEEPLHLNLSKIRIHNLELKKILGIGIPAGMQGVVFSTANVFIQSSINGYGSDAVAGSAAALNFEYYCYFGISAFVQTAVAFTSQNYGAGQYKRCRAIFWQSMALAVIACGIMNIAIFWQKDFFIHLFTSSPEVAEYGFMRIRYVLLFQFIASSYEVAGGCLRGMGYSMTPTILTIFGTCLLRLVWIYTVSADGGNFPLLMSVYPVSWVITGIAVLTAYFIISNQLFNNRVSA